MRAFIYLGFIALLAFLVGCNSQEASRNRGSANASRASQASQTPQQPAHTTSEARRINAEELHKLWQKNEVLIVDTRNEPAFKQSHIRGAILVPTTEFAARADELPKNRMIVTYCT